VSLWSVPLSFGAIPMTEHARHKPGNDQPGPRQRLRIGSMTADIAA